MKEESLQMTFQKMPLDDDDDDGDNDNGPSNSLFKNSNEASLIPVEPLSHQKEIPSGCHCTQSHLGKALVYSYLHQKFSFVEKREFVLKAFNNPFCSKKHETLSHVMYTYIELCYNYSFALNLQLHFI